MIGDCLEVCFTRALEHMLAQQATCVCPAGHVSAEQATWAGHVCLPSRPRVFAQQATCLPSRPPGQATWAGHVCLAQQATCVCPAGHVSAQQATPVCLAVVIYSRLTEAVSPTVNSLRHILMLANKDIQEMHFRVVCCVNNVSTLYIVIHRYCCQWRR